MDFRVWNGVLILCWCLIVVLVEYCNCVLQVLSYLCFGYICDFNVLLCKVFDEFLCIGVVVFDYYRVVLLFGEYNLEFGDEFVIDI